MQVTAPIRLILAIGQASMHTGHSDRGQAWAENTVPIILSHNAGPSCVTQLQKPGGKAVLVAWGTEEKVLSGAGLLQAPTPIPCTRTISCTCNNIPRELPSIFTFHSLSVFCCMYLTQEEKHEGVTTLSCGCTNQVPHLHTCGTSASR